MEEIDEKRKFQKRYEGWSSHRSWIFCGILYLWHDAVAGGLRIVAGSSDLPDQPDTRPVSLRDWTYFLRELIGGERQ